MTGLRTREVVSRMSEADVSKERDEVNRGLAESLAREMKARDASVAALAWATKIPESRIEGILRAEIEATVFEVPMFAEALGARPEDLVDGWDG